VVEAGRLTPLLRYLTPPQPYLLCVNASIDQAAGPRPYPPAPLRLGFSAYHNYEAEVAGLGRTSTFPREIVRTFLSLSLVAPEPPAQRGKSHSSGSGCEISST